MLNQDKKEMRQIFNEGITQLVLPHFDEMYKRLDTVEDDVKEVKKDVKNLKQDVEYLQQDIDKIDRKLDAEIEWRDDASKRLKNLELKINE